MKASVAVTLIICGTVMILAPRVESIIGTAQVAHLLAITQRPDANLSGSLSQTYTGWTVFVGIVMVLGGVLGAVKSKD